MALSVATMRDLAMWTFVSAASSKKHAWTKNRLTLEKLRQCEDVLIEFRRWRNSWTLLLSLWNLVWKPPMQSVSHFLWLKLIWLIKLSSDYQSYNMTWPFLLKHLFKHHMKEVLFSCFFWVTFSKSLWLCVTAWWRMTSCRTASLPLTTAHRQTWHVYFQPGLESDDYSWRNV